MDTTCSSKEKNPKNPAAADGKIVTGTQPQAQASPSGTPAGTAGAALSSKAKPSPAAAGNKKRVSGEAKPTHAHKTKGKAASKSESKTSSLLAQPVTEKSTAKPASNSYDEVMSRLDKLEVMFGKIHGSSAPSRP